MKAALYHSRTDMNHTYFDFKHGNIAWQELEHFSFTITPQVKARDDRKL